jgi:hypothetical protein
MLGSLVLIILASTLLFRASVNGQVDLPALLGTKNNGVLITPPRAIAELPLTLLDGEQFEFAKQPKHWNLLIPVVAHCDNQCEQNLYLTRQIHIALGKDADRVQRYLIATQWPLDAQFEELLKQHPGVQILRVDAAAFTAYFAKSNLQPARDQQYLLLDPAGWLMMYYTPQHDGKAVIKDLKFLLSNSHEQEEKN